jgi:hypothetical protein
MKRNPKDLSLSEQSKNSGKLNLLIGLIVALLFGSSAYFLSTQIDDIIFSFETDSSWFEADVARVVSNMSHRYSNHYRTAVHPLFSIASFPITNLISSTFKFSLNDSARIVSSLVASLWGALLFLILRGLGCKLIDSFFFLALAIVSAASIFWLSVPETYVWGSTTILIALGFALVVQKHQPAWYWHSVVSAITFSMTITNWMAGLLVSLAEFPGLSQIQKGLQGLIQKPKSSFSLSNLLKTWKGFFAVQFVALSLIFFMALVQRRFFPSAAVNFLASYRGELDYVAMPEMGGPFRALTSMLVHTIVMPEIRFEPKPDDLFNWPIMLTQLSAPGSASIWGAVAVGAWVGLLALGVWSFLKVRLHPKFRFVLGFTLLGQLGLHLAYGNETFLYSLHILPLLLLTVAFVSLTSFRPFGLGLTGVLVLVLSLNNFQQFRVAADYFHQYGTPRQMVRVEMQNRPNDPWPRGVGHVLLGIPGSYEEEKAYHEPGGSFSPVANSFGVSFWVIDSSRAPVATSDDIPLNTLQQSFSDKGNTGIPGILTQTEYYQALWQSEAENKWRLNLNPTLSNDQSLAILIRSVGPAGGAIDGLNWDGNGLSIQQSRSDLCSMAQAQKQQYQKLPLLANVSHDSLADRCQNSDTEQLQWSLKVNPQPKSVHIGHEGDVDWVKATDETYSWEGEDGWGFARLDFDPKEDVVLTIERLNPVSMPLLEQEPTPFTLNLPDQQFTDSLEAQIEHIKMSLVDDQTRPGEPINYPLPWQRDGAYTVVALARAGQFDIAKQTALYFAEHDFFGGFGPEADAPGLSLWALDQVSIQVKDAEFDRQIWPHVKRKVESIERMLTATENLYEPISAPVTPEAQRDPDLNLIANAAEGGLITGRMDHHRPVLFVNAVSYSGLVAASDLADRLGYNAEKMQWRDQADQLRKAWLTKFQSGDDGNVRTYISALWPTWVVSDDLDLYRKRLDTRLSQLESSVQNGTYEPEYTYFDIAEAHQWLYLEEVQPVWNTLKWFWQHQASPGLYTWWEGRGEENTSHFWKFIRGWVNPRHVTPHYWTASEVLLLQLDALAYIDKSSPTPELVIAAGVPDEWFEQPMSVENLPIEGRTVSWSWDRKSFQVKLEGEPIKVRLGSKVPQ